MDRLKRGAAWCAALFLMFALTALPVVSAPAPTAKTLAQGARASGSADTDIYPVLVAGSTSGNVLTKLLTGSDGSLSVMGAGAGLAAQVEGQVADGGSATGINPVLGGVLSAGLVEAMLGDSTGRAIVQGAAADSTSVAGLNPFLMAGSNGASVTTLTAATAADDASATSALRTFSLGGCWNGTGVDRNRRASTADGTTGTGLLGVGALGHDGTNFQTLSCDTTGRAIVQGAAADSTSVAGLNPFLMAGSNGASVTTLMAATAADDASGGGSLRAYSQKGSWNGTGVDRDRNNVDISILASASRTTTQQVTFTNHNGRGLLVILDMTIVTAAPSVTLSIEAQDAVSGKFYTLLTGAAVTTISTNVYRVAPGLTAAANAVANDIPPRLLRITVTANNANAGTYSVGVSLVTA